VGDDVVTVGVWEAPDWIVLRAAILGNTSAFGKALKELHVLGLISRMPRLAVIQAEGAAPFYDLFISESSTLKPIAEPSTLATAIRIGSPVSWKKAVRSLGLDGRNRRQRQRAGKSPTAKAIIGMDGIGCEPASAATLAGIKTLASSGTIGATDSVVAVLTGNLMKDSGLYGRLSLRNAHARTPQDRGYLR
jgi:threonine synthase